MCFVNKVLDGRRKRGSLCKVHGFPDLTLMAVLVEQMEGQRDLITEKTIWHLSDDQIKTVCKCHMLHSISFSSLL